MTIIDEKIKQMFDVLASQKKEVELTERKASRKWLTNCSFTFRNSDVVNIATASEAKIREVVECLLQSKEYSNKASEILGLSEIDTYHGYSYDAWYDDCKKRIAMLQLRAKKDKLNELEVRLNAIVSPEHRRQMELDAIVKELGN